MMPWRINCGHHHVFEGGQLRQQVIELEDEPERAVSEAVALGIGLIVDARVLEMNLAGIGPVEQPQDVQQRALSRPARARHGHHLAALDFQIDPAQAPGLRSSPSSSSWSDRMLSNVRSSSSPSVGWINASRAIGSFEPQGSDRMDVGRPVGRPDAGQHGDQEGADHDPADGERVDESGSCRSSKSCHQKPCGA